MSISEIPRNELSLFFDSFSLRHEGQLISLEVDSELINKVGTEAAEIPLYGIAVDENAGENVITITVGDEGIARLRHEISVPTQVLLEQTDDGYDKALEITAQSEIAWLELRNPRPI